MTVKEGLTDKMNTCIRTSMSLITKHGSPISGREQEFSHPRAFWTRFIEESQASSQISIRLIFREDAASVGKGLASCYPPRVTGSGAPAEKFQPLYLLIGKSSKLDNEKSKGQNRERNIAIGHLC